MGLGSLPLSEKVPEMYCTVLPVVANFSLVFSLTFQSLLHLLSHSLARFFSVEKATRTRLLHDLGSCEASQFTEAIGTVDNRITSTALRVSKQEVAV